jgi:hypothetical protein
MAGEIRVIKHLLLNGASRDSQDTDGKRPVDYVSPDSDTYLAIIGAMKKPSYCARINPV